MEDVKSKIEQYLAENKVDYQLIEHPPAASAEEYNRTLNTRCEQQAKVLLISYKADGANNFAVLAIQGHKRAELEKLRQAIGASKARLADREQLKEITGCNFGELHPFAKLFGLKLIMDKDLLSEKSIYINTGCLDHSIVVDPLAVQMLEEPLLI